MMLGFRQTAAAALLLALAAGAAPADQPVYAPLEFDDVKSRVLEWVARQDVDDERVRRQVGQLWAVADDSLDPRGLFDKVIGTFAVVDEQTKRFVDSCSLVDPSLLPPEPEALSQENTGQFYRANMRLFYGRYLAQRRMYDEALEVFEGLDPSAVVDPASCLFYKAVCQHQLLMKNEGLETLELLLTSTEDVPVSYSSVAELMQYELENLREESLDGVARLMKDVERRLDLAHGGPKVQKKEDEIIARLDAIIEKLEQQSGGGGGGGGGRPQGNQSSGPAQESYVGGAKAPGEVDKKNLRTEGGWGNLPPKQEARAKNLLNRNLPPHYKQATEEYLKKLAQHRLRTRTGR